MRLKLYRAAVVLPFLLASLLWFSDWAVARLVLPFRESILVLLAVQLAASMWAVSRIAGGRLRLCHAGVVVLAIILGGWVYAREYGDHREDTVRFASAGATLAGTVYTPHSAGPYAGIVLVHGSGKFPRRMYRLWAQGLVRQGFQVLVYDKRGTGDSGGAYEGENNTSRKNLDLLAQDASSAVDFLVSRGSVTGHIGLFGISQGGWVATLAAQKNPKVRFMILHSGPAVSVGEENRYSELTGEGHSLGAMEIGKAEEKVAQGTPRGFDPRPVLQGLDVTALWLFGDHDSSIPVHNSVASLMKLNQEGKPYAYKVFSGSDHLLLTRDGNLLPDLPPDYWGTIASWAKQYEHRPVLAAGRN